MDQNTLNVVIAAIAGVLAGHGTGAVNQTTSLGPIGNTITGVVGGVGGSVLGALIPALQQIGSGTVNGANLGAGAIGGIILTAIFGMITNSGSSTSKQ